MAMGLVDLEQLPPLVEELEDQEIFDPPRAAGAAGRVALREALLSTPHDPVPLLLGIPEARAEASTRSATR